MPPFRRILGAVVLVAAVPAAGLAQEMEPKAYSASAVGGNFLVAAYSRSTGGVVFDPSIPVTDVNARIGGISLGYGHTFGLFGKLALVTMGLPYAWGKVTGKVYETAAETTRSGLADGRFKLSVNLRGNPAMPMAKFVKAPRRTIIGASLLVTIPTGQYYETKLINLGTNRWGFKPEVGISVPKGRWDLDAYLGVWFFTSNPSFYPGGLKRTQDPVVAFQAHAAYTIRPRMWLAGDATWYSGGSSQVEGGAPSGSFNNSRLGATLSLPVGRRHSLKVSYSSGLVVRTGSDFRTLAVGWQTLWLSKPRPSAAPAQR